MITFKYANKEKLTLKSGAIVNIRKNLKGKEYYGGVYFNAKMEKYCGKTAKIVGVNADGRFVLDIDREWTWSKEMLEKPQLAK